MRIMVKGIGRKSNIPLQETIETIRPSNTQQMFESFNEKQHKISLHDLYILRGWDIKSVELVSVKPRYRLQVGGHFDHSFRSHIIGHFTMSDHAEFKRHYLYRSETPHEYSISDLYSLYGWKIVRLEKIDKEMSEHINQLRTIDMNLRNR